MKHGWQTREQRMEYKVEKTKEAFCHKIVGCYIVSKLIFILRQETITGTFNHRIYTKIYL